MTRPDSLFWTVQNISLRKDLPAECQHQEAISSLYSVLTTAICSLPSDHEAMGWMQTKGCPGCFIYVRLSRAENSPLVTTVHIHLPV